MKKHTLMCLAIALTSSCSLTAQVAINDDGSNPVPSAMLDVKSTNKGLLPPRMTEAQRDAIINSDAGLIVWCTNCGPDGELQVYNGTTWTNMIGGAASAVPSPPIGTFYQGGVVFYVDGSGGGLVCAIMDQGAAEWGCYGIEITGADGLEIGAGAQNTIDIEAECLSPGIAADTCAKLSLNGYNDWFLPSRDELNEMYQNKATINATAILNGGSAFIEEIYWSSTEYSNNNAWAQYFDPIGGQGGIEKNANWFRVRAVRAF